MRDYMGNETFDGSVRFKFTGCEMRVARDVTYRELVMILEMLETQIGNGYEIDNIDIKRNLRSL